MDIDKIVAEVLKRIEEKTHIEPDLKNDDDRRHKVLIISREESQGHFLSEKMDKLISDCSIDCTADDKYPEKQYDMVLVEGLDDTGLAKMAAGIFDESYLKSIHKALVEGREVILNRDSLEIFAYRDSMPAGLFVFYQERLNTLEGWGIKVLNAEEIVSHLKSKKISSSHSKEIQGKNLMKRVVTERDIRETLEEGQKTVTVMPNTIITDIAKETALKKGVNIVICKE